MARLLRALWSLLPLRAAHSAAFGDGGGGDDEALDGDAMEYDVPQRELSPPRSLHSAPVPFQYRAAQRGRAQASVSPAPLPSSYGDGGGMPPSFAKHLYLPHVLAGYLQLFFNVCVVFGLLYLCFAVVSTISLDVDRKVVQYSAEILQEIALCSRNYVENKCRPDERLPAMKEICATWETCMSRDPTAVGTARVGAETFGQILNSFVEPISYKTMAFFTLLILGTLVLSNIAFQVVRAKLPTPAPAPYYYREEHAVPRLAPPDTAAGAVARNSPAKQRFRFPPSGRHR